MARDRIFDRESYEGFVESQFYNITRESMVLIPHASSLKERDLPTNDPNAKVYRPLAEIVALTAGEKRFGGQDKTDKRADAAEGLSPLQELIKDDVRHVGELNGLSERSVRRIVGTMATIINATVGDMERRIISYQPATPRI